MPTTIVPDPDRDLSEQLAEVFAKIKAEFHNLVGWFPRPDTPHGGVISVPTEEEMGTAIPAPEVGTNFSAPPKEAPAGAAATAGNQSPAPAGPAATAPAATEDDKTPPPAAPEAASPAPVPEPAAPAAAPTQATSGPRTAQRDAGRKAVPVAPKPAQEKTA